MVGCSYIEMGSELPTLLSHQKSIFKSAINKISEKSVIHSSCYNFWKFSHVHQLLCTLNRQRNKEQEESKLHNKTDPTFIDNNPN